MRKHTMRKTLLTLLALALALSAGALGVGAQSPGNNVLGDVVAVDAAAKQIFVKTDAGAVVIVSVSDATRVLKNPPGETKTDKAVPYTLAEIVAGDRVLALGKLSDDGKTLAGPRVVVVNTKAELTAKQEKESTFPICESPEDFDASFKGKKGLLGYCMTAEDVRRSGRSSPS